MAEEASGLRIRVTPVLRGLIEAASKLNGRTMNAEIAARLQWSFDHGYDVGEETKNRTASVLEAIQATPIVRLEKRLDQFETGTDEKFEELFGRVNEIDRSRDALEQKVSDLEEALKRHGIEV